MDELIILLCVRVLFTAGVCDLPINIITPLCNNGATCVNTGVFEYHCMCLAGYEGRYCEKRTNYGQFHQRQFVDTYVGHNNYSGLWVGEIYNPSCLLSLPPSLFLSSTGVCNMTKLCHNDGVCINSEDGKDYECLCQNDFTGDNCTLGELQGTQFNTIIPFTNVNFYLQHKSVHGQKYYVHSTKEKSNIIL